MNTAERELREALEHYSHDKNTCSQCGRKIQFCDACVDCGAPDNDCFDYHTFGSCAVCLGCEEDGGDW